MKENIKSKLHYLIAPLIVLVTFTVIMLIKGMYPFGTNLIASLNMDDVYIPVYYKLYDILHGNASIFYDYNLGGGTSILGTLISNGLLSPLSWIVYFSSRSYIPYFMTFIVLIKFMFISITSYYAFGKLFKNTGRFYNILFSLIYTLSGYTILMYSNIIWLENIALLPLLVLGLKNIFENKKSKLFVTALVLSLINNYQISFMIIAFLVIFTCLGLYYLVSKEDRKQIASKVLTYILFSVLVSAFAILPCIMQDVTSYKLISNLNESYLFEKLIYFFPTTLTIILFIKQITNRKNDKKYSIFYLLLFILSIIGIFVPSINKVINTGTYSNFPFKYGFIPIFVLILGSMHYLNNSKDILKTKVNKNFALVAYIILNVFLIYIINTFKNVMLDSNISVDIQYVKQFIALLVIFIVNLLIVYIALLNSEKFRKFLLIYSTCVSIIIFGYFAIPKISSTINLKEFEESITSNTDSIYRYKDNTLSLGANFSQVLNIPSNSSFTSTNSESQYKNYYNLGHLTEGLSLYSSGGTIFSDLITANKYIISYQELPDKLYKLVKENNGVYYYESKYNLSFAIPYFGDTYNSYGSSIFNYQNKIYQKLFNKKDNIIEISKPSFEYKNIDVTDENFYYPTDEESSFKFTTEVKELSNLYINLDIEYGNVYAIFVNGVAIKNPTLTNRHNKTFPISDQTTILLGQFENETVEVSLKTEGVIINDYELGLLSINKFINLVEDNKENISVSTKMNTMKISYNNTDDNKSLLIPINYSDGFTITNNNKEISYTSNFNNYISVDLEEGNNYIVIKYRPKYFDLGLYLSIMTILVSNLFIYLNKKFNLFKNKLYFNTASTILYILAVILFLKVYIFSLF